MCDGGSDGLAIKTGLKGESSFRFIRKTRRKKEEEEEEEERSSLSLSLSLFLSRVLGFDFHLLFELGIGFEFVDLDCVNVEDLIEAFSSESVELGEIHSKSPKWKSRFPSVIKKPVLISLGFAEKRRRNSLFCFVLFPSSNLSFGFDFGFGFAGAFRRDLTHFLKKSQLVDS
ncbi:hypothetical protein EV2_044117 [Malus domestica]